jgi:DNA-binding NarL/FixJ family response regulator
MTYTGKSHRPCGRHPRRCSIGDMNRRPPTIAVVSDHRRVGRALVAYLSSDGSAAAQVIGPYTYHAGQEQFRHAQAILCDLDSCDLAAAFYLMERVAAAHIPVLAVSASAALRAKALTWGAAACADKSAAALDELVRQLADLTSGKPNETG